MPRTQRASRRLRLLRLGLALGAVVVAAAAIEITFTVLEANGIVTLRYVNNPGRTGDALEVYDPDLGWRNASNFYDDRVWAHGERVVERTDPHGWRNVFRGSTPDPFRIAVLGCSFTYGFGVSQDDTYSAALYRQLDDAPRDVELINAGVSGYGIDQFVLTYETHVRDIHPDLVIVQLGWFDALRAKYDEMWSTPKPRFVLRDGRLELTNHPVPKKRFAGVERWLLGTSATYRFMKDVWLAKADRDVLDARGSTWNDVELRELVIALLRRLKQATARDGADLVAFYWIDRGPMGEDGDWPARWCEAAGVDVVRLEDWADEAAFRRRGDLEYPPPVLHWTPLGHRWVATALARYLRDRFDLPARRVVPTPQHGSATDGELLPTGARRRTAKPSPRRHDGAATQR